jgi:hypothetical protein
MLGFVLFNVVIMVSVIILIVVAPNKIQSLLIYEKGIFFLYKIDI